MIIHRRIIACLFAFIVISAAPSRSEELIREANAAFEQEDYAVAEKLYASAIERGTDPGLIAFNQGAVLSKRSQYAEAEAYYRRVLDDAEAPQERRAKAWYYLGNCLMSRSPKLEVAKVRTAIECYQRCLASSPDDELRKHAEHNLELAKLLWMQARTQEEQPANPNDPPPETSNLPKPENKNSSENGDDSPQNGNSSKQQKSNAQVPKNAQPKQSDQRPSPGAGQLPVLPDTDSLQPIDPDSTTDYLSQAAERLQRERRNLSRTANGGERRDVKNW